MTDDNDRTTCAALAALLRAMTVLALWGFALTCISALVLALTLRSLSTTSTMGFGAVVILGALERYFAFRLRFDEALFDGLARNTVASLDAKYSVCSALGLVPDLMARTPVSRPATPMMSLPATTASPRRSTVLSWWPARAPCSSLP